MVDLDLGTGSIGADNLAKHRAKAETHYYQVVNASAMFVNTSNTTVYLKGTTHIAREAHGGFQVWRLK